MSQTRLAILTLSLAITGGLLVIWLLYPAPIVSGSAEVPELRGVPASRAVADLAALGLRGRIGKEMADPLVAEGSISWQSPAPYTVLPESAVVLLGVSSGLPSVVVPALLDLDLETATQVLQAAGLTVGKVDSIWSSEPRGAIVITRPDAHTGKQAGGAVDITVSKGPRGGKK